MKLKLVLFFFSISLVLFGCKKDHTVEDPLTSTKNQIVGTWLVTSAITNYYDTSGKLIDSESFDSDTTKFLFDTNSLKISNADTGALPYTLTNVNGKIMVEVASESYEVSLSNGTMAWIQRKQYQHEAYANSVYTIQFKKQ